MSDAPRTREPRRSTRSGATPLARRAALLLGLLAILACRDRVEDEPIDYEPLVTFDSGAVRILTGTDTIPLTVELAASESQRAYGLMERDALDPGAGMLFVYDAPQPAGSGFWMYRTRIPLDIAFADTAGVIRAILTMQPCPSPEPRWCEVYSPGVPYQSALEVNAGFFAERGITVGDTIEVVGSP